MISSIYLDILNFIPGLLGLVLFLSIIFIVLSFMGLFIKKRSTISGIMFFLACSGICTFICRFKINDLELVSHIETLGNEYGIGEGLASAIYAIGAPVFYAHKLFLDMVAGVFSLDPSDDKLALINNGIFVMLVYIFLFFLSFIFFSRKKKTKKIYSDYLS